jgi:hypothetical protein
MEAAFDTNHYVPVLKIKQGEKQALELISDQHCARITPLLEIVARDGEKKPTFQDHLDTAFKGLAQGATRFPRCLLDAREIAPDGPAAAKEVFKRARAAGITFAPVTGVTRKVDVAAALAARNNGLAIRLTRQEFETGRLNGLLLAFLATHSLQAEEIDLIVDLGAVNQLIQAGVLSLAAQFIEVVPYLDRWRSFTLSSAAIPEGMGGIERHSFGRVRRIDWLAWLDVCLKVRPPRLPSFSDCCIQHPKGVEGFNFQTMTPSASIRYTLDEDWLLIKGQSTKVEAIGKQLPKLATKLVKGVFKPHYRGASHCKGCQMIADSAGGKPKLGSATVWRRIGTIHHVEMVMEGMQAEPWL